MKEQLLEQIARFDALAKRERALIAAAVLLGGSFLGYTFFIEPHVLRQKTQAKRLAQAKTELATTQAELTVRKADLVDPDAKNRLALAQTREELAAIDAKLSEFQNSMVPPEKMQEFLKGLLAKNRSLELVSLRTLPPTPLMDAPDAKTEVKPDSKAENKPVAPGVPAAPTAAAAAAAADAANAPSIFKHGVEIRISGNYHDLLAYVRQVEGLPHRILWNRIELASEKYPVSVLTLTVFTLSQDKQWLVV